MLEYHRPASVEEAVGVLAGRPGSVVLAGGTDLVPAYRAGRQSVRGYVSLRGIPGVGELSVGADGLVIRPLSTHAAVASHPEVWARWPALAWACQSVGSVQVRNLGTVVGNICHASPAADTASALLTLGAVVEARSLQGTRDIPIAEFFLGSGRTVLQPGEMVSAIRVPPPAGLGGGAYVKISPRRAMDIAVVGAAVSLWLDENGRCLDCRVALASVAPVPLLTGAGAAVVGQQLALPHDGTWELVSGVHDIFAQAAQLATEAASPISDVRASADYRRAMIPVAVRRALWQALGRATPGEWVIREGVQA